MQNLAAPEIQYDPIKRVPLCCLSGIYDGRPFLAVGVLAVVPRNVRRGVADNHKTSGTRYLLLSAVRRRHEVRASSLAHDGASLRKGKQNGKRANELLYMCIKNPVRV